MYKNVKMANKMTLGDSIDTSYLNHTAENQHDHSSSYSGVGTKQVLLLRNQMQNNTGELKSVQNDVHDLRS